VFVQWDTLKGTEAAVQLAKEVAGIDVQRIAQQAGVNRTSFYRKLVTTFETLAVLAEVARDGAFSFAMSGLMYGLHRRDRREALRTTG